MTKPSVRKVDRTGMLITPISVLAAGLLFGGFLLSEAQKLADAPSPSAYSAHAMDTEGGNVLAVALQDLMRVYVSAVGAMASRATAVLILLGAIAWFVRGIRKYRAQVAADRQVMVPAEG